MIANGADEAFGSVLLFVNWWLVDGHDVGSQVVSLEEALVAKMAPVRLHFGVHRQDVLRQVVLPRELQTHRIYK